jgi:hypothetical protein
MELVQKTVYIAEKNAYLVSSMVFPIPIRYPYEIVPIAWISM